MPLPFTVGEKLRVQFRKSLGKGCVRNAKLDRDMSVAVHQVAVKDESFIVRVDRSKGGRFWFSKYQVLFENEVVYEILRYDCVRSVHWMFKDLWDRTKVDAQSPRRPEERVLDGLGQAYSLLLHFFRWMLKNTPKSGELDQ